MNRIYLLDIARGFAAISVAIFHYKLFYSNGLNLNPFNENNQPFFNYLYLIYEYGWLAVQFFFLLSGFIFFKMYLDLIYKKKITFYNFIILRLSRLYPLHFFTLVLVLIIFIFLNLGGYSNPIRVDFKHLILNLLLIHEWGLNSFPSLNEPSWSISIELLMYIVFFYIALKQNIIFYSILAIIISSILFFKYKFIGYGGYCFFIGGLNCFLLDKIKISQNLKIILLSILVFLSTLFFIEFVENKILKKIILLTIFFPSLINILYLINLKAPNIGKKYSVIGDISYSIYLIHFPIILTALLLFQHFEIQINPDSSFIFLTYLTTIFLLSFFTYRLIEIPFKKIIRLKYLNNDK